MLTNKYGVRGLKSVQLKRGLVYFWLPLVSLQKAGIFHHKTLGMDFDIAATRAHHWNAKLKAHRLSVNGVKPTLSVINLMSVAYLLREFEASPRFARYSPRTREDYSYIYRHVETHIIDGQRMFGAVPISEVTKQMVYTLYEKYVTAHGNDSTNKTITACQAAFNYGTLRFTGIQLIRSRTSVRQDRCPGDDGGLTRNLRPSLIKQPRWDIPQLADWHQNNHF